MMGYGGDLLGALPRWSTTNLLPNNQEVIVMPVSSLPVLALWITATGLDTVICPSSPHHLTAASEGPPTRLLLEVPNLRSVQEGQSHLVFSGGRSSKPTQEMWNHSLSHDFLLSHAIIVP